MKERDAENAEHLQRLEDETQEQILEDSQLTETWPVTCKHCAKAFRTCCMPLVGMRFTCPACLDERDQRVADNARHTKEMMEDRNDADAKSGNHHRIPRGWL
jgi:hypothetical protein